MEDEFMNEDVRRVMSKLMMKMQESEESHPFKTELSIVKDPGQEIPQDSDSPTKSKTIKPKDFANITLARMNGMKQKSMENIKKMTESKQEKEIAEIKTKPDINAHSKKIGKRNEPIFERVDKEITESKSKLEEIKQKLEVERNKKIMPELTFKPKIISKTDTKRSSDDYFKYNIEWIDRKNKKTERKREELEEKLKNQLKFTPEIDENSINIVSQTSIKKPIEDRLLEKLEFVKKKRQAEREEQIFSFAPVIEEKSRAIAKHKTDGDVFTRLFTLSKDQTTAVKSPKFENIKNAKNRSFSFSNDLEHDEAEFEADKKLEFLFDLS